MIDETIPDGTSTPDSQPTIPAKPGELEKILWTEWIGNYWIATFSEKETRVFLKACKQNHGNIEHSRKQSKEGVAMLTTSYYKGEDGYTYMDIQHGINSPITAMPIYKVSGVLGDIGN
jgi:hypothetical protein